MHTSLKGKHLITLRDWDNQEINMVLETARDLKRKFYMGLETNYLKHKTIALMFLKLLQEPEIPWKWVWPS